MALDDSFADVESEAKADARAASDLDIWNAVEAFPNVCLLGGREAGAMVGDREASEWLIHRR